MKGGGESAAVIDRLGLQQLVPRPRRHQQNWGCDLDASSKCRISNSACPVRFVINSRVQTSAVTHCMRHGSHDESGFGHLFELNRFDSGAGKHRLGKYLSYVTCIVVSRAMRNTAGFPDGWDVTSYDVGVPAGARNRMPAAEILTLMRKASPNALSLSGIHFLAPPQFLQQGTCRRKQASSARSIATERK